MDKKRKMEIHLHTNNTCNLQCCHCYNSSGKSVKPALPPVEKLIQTIQYLCEKYDAEIHLEGGEIFLRPDLLRQMNDLNKNILKNITITTNGMICIKDREILSMLQKIDTLRISVEGHTDEQQMQIRGVKLQPILENAAYYQTMGIPVCLRITLNRYNYWCLLNQTIPIFIEKGFRRIQVYEFQSIGRGKIYSDKLALDDSIGTFLSELEQRGTFSDANVKIMFPRTRIIEVENYKEDLEQRGILVEKISSEDSISIHADGSVYVCPWDNDTKNNLFNIWDTELEVADRYLQEREFIHFCQYCSALRIIC